VMACHVVVIVISSNVACHDFDMKKSIKLNNTEEFLSYLFNDTL